jgi:hypothetical protein
MAKISKAFVTHEELGDYPLFGAQDYYSKDELDAFFEGEDADKKQVHWDRVVSKPATYPPDAHTLASHSTKAHSELTGVTANLHHAESHTLASHSTKPHSALTSVTANQHHAESHTLASHSTKPHSALTGVTANQHHNQVHALIGSDHSASGLTVGYVLKATGATSFAFQANNLDGLSDVNLGSLEEGETIMYDQASGDWVDAWGVEYDNPRLVWKIKTDFFTKDDNSNDPWVGATLIAGTCVSRPGNEDHPGQVRLSSSAGSTDRGYRWLTATDCIQLDGAESSEFVFKTSINLSNVRVRLGFQDSNSDTAPTDGMYIDINGTTLKGITRSNGSETVTGTTYTISTSTWYRCKMALSSDGATASFWLYNESGTQLWTNTCTSNIPTGSSRQVGHGAVAWNDADAGQILIDLDMMVATRAGTISR